MITLLCLSVPIIGLYPFYKIFKSSFLAKYLVANIMALVAPYFLFKVSFECSKYLSMIVISEEKEKGGDPEAAKLNKSE
jgi:hypothetical protein